MGYTKLNSLSTGFPKLKFLSSKLLWKIAIFERTISALNSYKVKNDCAVNSAETRKMQAVSLAVRIQNWKHSIKTSSA